MPGQVVIEVGGRFRDATGLFSDRSELQRVQKAAVGESDLRLQQAQDATWARDKLVG